MAEIANYDPSKIVFIVGGVPITGFADGTFITIEPMTEGFTSMVGSDGEVARTISTDNRLKITCALMQTSNSNQVLSNLYLVDRLSGRGVFAMLVEDLIGGTIMASGQSWIVKQATAKFGKTTESREWEFCAVPATSSLYSLAGG
jgi:hypothetical protein